MQYWNNSISLKKIVNLILFRNSILDYAEEKQSYVQHLYLYLWKTITGDKNERELELKYACIRSTKLQI